jgi:hypothetical protein
MEPEGSIPYIDMPTTGPYWIQSVVPALSVMFLVILFLYLRSDPTNNLFYSGFQEKIMYAFLKSSMGAKWEIRRS